MRRAISYLDSDPRVLKCGRNPYFLRCRGASLLIRICARDCDKPGMGCADCEINLSSATALSFAALICTHNSRLAYVEDVLGCSAHSRGLCGACWSCFLVLVLCKVIVRQSRMARQGTALHKPAQAVLRMRRYAWFSTDAATELTTGPNALYYGAGNQTALTALGKIYLEQLHDSGCSSVR